MCGGAGSRQSPAGCSPLLGSATVSDLEILAAVPIKPFGVAKRRLSPALDATARSRLGKALARRTLQKVAEAGALSVVVTADGSVAAWAASHDVETILDPGRGLNAAAATGVEAARSRGLRWAVVHADLPCVSVGDLQAAFSAIPDRGVVISPAHDGGTNLVAGDIDRFGFGYGPSSYQHHIRGAVGLPRRIVVRWGLALDLDSPGDLAQAMAATRGEWLHKLVETEVDGP